MLVHAANWHSHSHTHDSGAYDHNADLYGTGMDIGWIQVLPWVLVLGLALLYYRRHIYLVLGILVYVFSTWGPLADWVHQSFSIHMLQMSLHYFVVPPLVWLGIFRHPWYVDSRQCRPFVLLKGSRVFPWLRRIAIVPLLWVWRGLANPLVALLLFSGLMSIYHLPVVFDRIMTSHFWHNVSHILLLLTAFCSFFTMLSPWKEDGRSATVFLRMGLLVAYSICFLPVCSLIAFTDQLLYTTYVHDPPLWPYLSALDDVRMGGVVMKIFQEAAYITTLGHLFYRWVRISRAKADEEDAVFARSQSQASIHGEQ
ncbi:cytochrome c oxidase assembly protein [Pasteuria penetrans]|uniref:cytochrome c oxidase assembly protein n=1 Tax=Pasteuria penetrans TaxID=86005 RepID=UPI00165AF338|nr:cytochrome c oxidase assembly protein [Pasteuria penetrans]